MDRSNGTSSANALIYDERITHLLKYTATTVGRDKAVRAVQYWARFYAWYLLRTGATRDAIAPWERVKQQFGLSRKLFRVAKNIEHIKAAGLAYDAAGGDPVLKYTAVGRQLGYAGYLTLDTATYLDAIGAVNPPSMSSKDVQRNAYKCWAFGLSCNIVSGLYSLYRLRPAASSSVDVAEKSVEEKVAKKKRDDVSFQLLLDVLDLTIPVSGLQYLPLDDGLVGLAGFTSSLMGIYLQWQKTA